MKHLKLFSSAIDGDGKVVYTPFVGKIQGDTPKYVYCGKELGPEVTLAYDNGVLDAAIRYTLQQLQDPADVYILKYEDENLEPLDEEKYETIYANHLQEACGEVQVQSGDNILCPHTKLKLIPCNFAPYLAKYIGVYDLEGNRITGLRIKGTSLDKSFGERSYRVGLFSDVHYLDTGGTELDMKEHAQGTENESSEIQNALSFFNEKDAESKIAFICCAGDVTCDDIEHARNFREITNYYAPNTPVYACKGNHDNKASYGNNELWLQYTMPSLDDPNITYFTSGDKTSFYFTRNDSGTTDVYIFFNVNYQTNSTTSPGKCYLTEDIEQLQMILDQHRNDRCFIVTHQFFPQKSGTPCDDYTTGGNSHSKDYYLHGRDFAYLNELNNYYVNSVWFTGHSHYQWKWQQDSARANVCNWDTFNGDYKYDDLYDEDGKMKNTSEDYSNSYMKSAWNVHIPSTCRPLRLGKYYGGYNIAKIYDGDDLIGSGSEGGIMDVYKDYVDIRGVVFRDELSGGLDFTNKYSFLANYRLSVGGSNNVQLDSHDFQYFRDIVNTRYTKIDEPLTLANDIVINDQKSNADADNQIVGEDPDNPNTITLTFTNSNQAYIVTNYPTQSIYIDELSIWWEGEDVTNSFTSLNSADGCPYSSQVIGIFGTDSLYHVEGLCTAMVSTYNGVEINASGSKITQWPYTTSGGAQIVPSADQPLTVKLTARFYNSEDDD